MRKPHVELCMKADVRSGVAKLTMEKKIQELTIHNFLPRKQFI